jgi:uroporphyrinogen decarboxylase
MSQLKNDRFLRAVSHQPVDTTPIWIMRQAGRYLPEYRKTREKAGSFMNLCKTPELACEVTLQPLQRFDLDASIIFSDILTIPDAMGLGLEFVEGSGPQFARPIRHERDINRLAVPDAEKLQYVYEAIKLVQHELAGRIPLIGFCGSPYTMAAYMIEGQSRKDFPLISKLLEESPFLLHTLLDVLAESVIAHLNAQIEAGVQAVMLFDTWGGMLDTKNYEEFSLYYLRQIIQGLSGNYTKKIPVILFTKGGNRWLEKMAETGCDVLGVDHEISLQEARKRVGDKIALQGNMNPQILLESADEIQQDAERILESYGQGSGHVFNLGHGITPDVPPEHVKVLVDTVHELGKRFHTEKVSK